MQKSKLMPTAVLCAICIVAVALLALVNIATAPVIAENQEAKSNEALQQVMPEGSKFEKLDISGLPQEVTGAYMSDNGGYVFRVTVTGYKSGLIIMCGIDSNGSITGAKFIQSSETLGAESELGGKYVGKTESDYLTVDTISGATMTSRGYQNAIKAAFEAYKILTEGEDQ